MDAIFDSGDLPKRKGVYRSYVGGNHGHMIFRVRSGRHNDRIVVDLHSSVSRKSIGRSGSYWSERAATSLRLNKDEAMYVLMALLAAMNEA